MQSSSPIGSDDFAEGTGETHCRPGNLSKSASILKQAAAGPGDLAALTARARNLRRHVLRMAECVGQGYVGQGLGIADLLAVLYFHELRFDPRRLDWPDRDRFVLSTGHYAIGLYAALAEAGVLLLDELDTYGADGSRLEM